MAQGTGPTNERLQELIQELKKKETKLWKRIAADLEKPTRKRRVVNLSRINRFTKENETVIVPGKVLGSGVLDHKVTIAAFTFSQGAVEKITLAKANAIALEEFIKVDIKGKRVRILG
jgi:large subunit ribosomal protein L18e